MNLIRKGHGHAHRGIIGVESAIVMIAFVIVAAALAFVVLNMGFSTTQKAKTTIISSLGEASTALQISGKVTGIACTASSSDASCATTAVLNVTTFPIKIASGGDSINLAEADTAIKYLSNTVEYTDIYDCLLTGTTYNNITQAFTAAARDANCGDFPTETTNPVVNSTTAATSAIIYWTVDSNSNSIIDSGEHVVLAIAFTDTGTDDRPASLDKLRTEILLSTGASLTVERQVPNISNLVVDMG